MAEGAGARREIRGRLKAAAARARNVVLEFDTYDAARAEVSLCRVSGGAGALREGAAEVEIVLVEGA